MKKIILIVIAFAFLINAQTTWYIDQVTGSNSNGGQSATDAFASFWESGVISVWDSVGAGDVVIVKDGNYTEFNNFATTFSFNIDSTIPAATPVRWIGDGDNVNLKCPTNVAWYMPGRNQSFYNFNIYALGYSVAMVIGSDYNSGIADQLVTSTDMGFYNCDFFIYGVITMFHENGTLTTHYPYYNLTIDGCTLSIWPGAAAKKPQFYMDHRLAGSRGESTMYFTNNTFYTDSADISSAYDGAVMYFHSCAYATVLVENNILVGGTNASGDKSGAISFNGADTQYPNFSENNNVFYTQEGVLTGWVPINTIAGDSVIDMSTTSVVMDPGFVDKANDDYNLLSTSPALFRKTIPGARLPNYIR